MIDDLVCGTEVDEGATAIASVNKGKPYYHRAPGCKGAFDAAPEKLVQTLHPRFPLPVSVNRAVPCGNNAGSREAIV